MENGPCPITGTGARKFFEKIFLLDVRKRPTLGGEITTVGNVCLTNTVEECKIRPGAAQEAGGWSHHPRGGEACADYFDVPYLRVCRNDKSKKRKPPPWPVTVFCTLV